MSILEADTGLKLHESMYEDGLGLERLLEGVGGKRLTAIRIIRDLVRQAATDDAEPSIIHSWNYFLRPAKIEMQRLQTT